MIQKPKVGMKVKYIGNDPYHAGKEAGKILTVSFDRSTVMILWEESDPTYIIPSKYLIEETEDNIESIW